MQSAGMAVIDRQYLAIKMLSLGESSVLMQSNCRGEKVREISFMCHKPPNLMSNGNGTASHKKLHPSKKGVESLYLPSAEAEGMPFSTRWRRRWRRRSQRW